MAHSACVARPASKAEAARNVDAKAALDKEWNRLREINTWIEKDVMEFRDMQELMRSQGDEVPHRETVRHIGGKECRAA